MTARTASRLIRIVTAAALAVVASAGSRGPVEAGGWAVASVDVIPAAEAGATIDVSFMILQHGISPVDLDEGVGIEIRDDGAVLSFFPAVGDGAIGHYSATVTFPEAAGTYEWSVRMGGFGPHEMGTLNVSTPEPSSVTDWATVRWLALAASMLLAGIAVVDLVVARRRRPALG